MFKILLILIALVHLDLEYFKIYNVLNPLIAVACLVEWWVERS